MAVVAVSLSCSNDATLTGVFGEADIVADEMGAVTTSVVSPDVIAKREMKYVPIHGGGTFVPKWSEGVVACTNGPGGEVIVDGDGNPLVVVPKVLQGPSWFSHLGTSSSEIVGAGCWPNMLGGLSGFGFGYHTSANGDVLEAQFYYDSTVEGDIDFTEIEFIGGSGRFEHASGQAVGTGYQNPQTGAGDYAIRGMISSVGSSR